MTLAQRLFLAGLLCLPVAAHATGDEFGGKGGVILTAKIPAGAQPGPQGAIAPQLYPGVSAQESARAALAPTSIVRALIGLRCGEKFGAAAVSLTDGGKPEPVTTKEPEAKNGKSEPKKPSGNLIGVSFQCYAPSGAPAKRPA